LGEEKLPAEKWVKERTETRVSEEDMEAGVMAKRRIDPKIALAEGAWANRTKSADTSLRDTKTGACRYSGGRNWTLHAPHLRFQVLRDGRSRQQDRYGWHAVHKTPLPPRS